MRRFTWAGLAVLAVGSLTGARGEAGAGASGWEHFWANRATEARAAFRREVAARPAPPPAASAAAQRGLSLLAEAGDSPGEAAVALAAALRAAPQHWSALAYWPRFVVAAESSGKDALLVATAAALAADPKAPSLLRDSARYVLAEEDDAHDRLAQADARRATMGYVRRWVAIGPFDNVSFSGFDNRFAPEEGIDLKARPAGLHGLQLAWRPLGLVARDGACLVGPALGSSQSVYYAATAIQPAAAGKARLGFDPAGASQVFVNGRCVFHDATDRQPIPALADQFQIPVTLNAGWNTVLIKLAGERMPPTFSLRLLAADGGPLTGWKVDPQRAAGAAEAPSQDAVEAPAPFPAYLEAAALAAAGDPEAGCALADGLRETGDSEQAVTAARAAAARQPASGWVRWRLAEALGADQQADEARAARTEAIKAAPWLVHARLMEIADEAESLAPPERIQQLRALLKTAPRSPECWRALAEVYLEAELEAEARKAARQALDNAPGESSWDLYLTFLMELGDDAEYHRAVREGGRRYPTSRVFLEAADLTPTQARALTERLLRREPSDVYLRGQLAEDGSRATRIAARRALRTLQPQNAYHCVELSELLRSAGNTGEAVALLREAIRLDPAQSSLRDKLQVLQKEKPVLDLVPATPTQPLLAKLPKAADHPGASAVWILDEARRVVYPDYAYLHRVRLIVRVFDAAGVEDFKEVPLGVESGEDVATVESARLIKADGKIERHEGVGRRQVSFPSLAPGDTVDLSYRVEGIQRGGLGQQFWAGWRFAQPGMPVKLSRFALVTPPAMEFRVEARGGAPAPTVRDAGAWRVREWRMADVPPIPREAMMPSVGELGPWLDISSVPSWQHIVRWYRDISRRRCQPDRAVRSRALELTRDCKTEQEKIRALVRFTQDLQYQTTPFRMSAFVPTAGKQVLRERYGDCKDKAALLTAMLDAVGIRARMVLLSGRSSGVTPLLPSPRFTHAIAVIDTAAGPLWVDATADAMEFGDLPFEDQGVPALVIDDATTELTTTPTLPADRSLAEDHHEGNLDAAGAFAGSSTIRFKGNAAWATRTVMREVPQDRTEEALRAMTAVLIPGALHRGGSLDQRSDRDAPFEIKLSYRAPRFGSPAGGFLLAPLPWGGLDEKIDALRQEGGRRHPLELSMLRGAQRSSVRLQLPPGYTVQDLQAEVTAAGSFGSYRFRYRVEGGVLIAERELLLTPLRVASADADAFLAFLEAHGAELRRQHVFRKP
jgi:tetratricopeptide (TPR) repeat protein